MAVTIVTNVTTVLNNSGDKTKLMVIYVTTVTMVTIGTLVTGIILLLNLHLLPLFLLLCCLPLSQ